MEGKAPLFKEYAGIDAFPICIESQNTSEIEDTKNITPMFGGVNLEDIAYSKNASKLKLCCKTLGFHFMTINMEQQL